jgi:hypothetical protein
MPKRLTDAEKAWRLISERQWQNDVQRLSTTLGWKYYHAPDNKPINGRIQKVVAGFPDCVLVKGKRLIFAELKRETGIISKEQVLWMDALRETGAEVYIWRPSQIKEIMAILQAK